YFLVTTRVPPPYTLFPYTTLFRSTAQFWRAQYEWYAHAPLAEKAGVSSAAIEAIRRGDPPSFGQKDEALVYRICTELFKSQRLSDRKSTRLNSSHQIISYAVFCLK